MLHCHLQVLLCSEIALQEDSPQISLLEELGGGAKKFSGLSIARHILRLLVNYDVIQPLPQISSAVCVSPTHSSPLSTPSASRSSAP